MLTQSLPLNGWWPRLLLLLLSYPLFFFGLGDRDLWSSHEARAAQDAQGILDDGNWLLPHLYDRRVEMQKPPLYYWAAALAGKMAGGEVTPLLVRLPAALAGLFSILAVYELLRRRGQPWAGLLAALILATMLRFTWDSRVARIDIPLSLVVTVAMLTLYLGCQARLQQRWWASRGWWALGYLSMAASLLLKGPIGLLLVAAGAGPYLLWERRHLRGVQLSLLWGIPLMLAVVGPWFWMANEATQGEFAREFLWRHNFQRGLGGDDQLDSHLHPWWHYLARLWFDMAPWSLLLPWAAWQCWRLRFWREKPEAVFGGLWFLGMLCFLSLMKYKRAEYLLPAYPGMALFLGTLLEHRLQAFSWPRLKWAMTGLATLVLVSAGGWAVYASYVVPQLEPTREMRSFAQAVRQRVPRPAMVLIFRVDSHALAYHLGKPVELLWQWENLDIWACQPTKVYVIMPQQWAEQWPQFLEAGHLYPVLTSDEVSAVPREDKLVLFCTQPP
jgi:4-amino-4-deoxy-L-arabinose transferase-like glycosyltransferase